MRIIFNICAVAVVVDISITTIVAVIATVKSIKTNKELVIPPWVGGLAIVNLFLIAVLYFGWPTNRAI